MSERLYRYIRTGLLLGVVPAFACLAIGTLIQLIRPTNPRVHPPLAEILPGMLRLDPASFLSLGMLLLYAAPICACIAAGIAFAKEKDGRGLLATLGVLAVIAGSVVLGRR